MTDKPNLRSIRYWVERGTELMVAGAFAIMLMMFLDSREEQRKMEVPPSDWFLVNDIFVPDHEVGSNPLMIYDREIRDTHRGFWIVEAQRQSSQGDSLFENTCSGSGVDHYDVADVLPEEGVRWEWFFGRPCPVPPGVYRLELTKDMSKPGYPVKAIPPKYSNTFRVYPVGELPEPGQK